MRAKEEGRMTRRFLGELSVCVVAPEGEKDSRERTGPGKGEDELNCAL